MTRTLVDQSTIPAATSGRSYLGITLVITGLLAALLNYLIQLAPVAYATEPLLDVWLEFALIGLVGGAFLLFVLPLPERLRFDLLPALPALFFVGILALTLKATPFTVGGYNGDARLYVASVTKMAAYVGYADLFYRDFPAFYPPLYFYLVGNVARLLGIEAYLVMKPALLVVMTLFPFITTWLWRRVLDLRLAAAPAFLMLVVFQWFRPHEWLALILFLPWWLHWVEGYGRPQGQTKRAQILWWVMGALIGAISFQLYFFWFFLGGVKLAGQVGLALLSSTRRREIWRELRLPIGMLLATALLSSLYWVPYLWSMAVTGGWKPLQNRFLTPNRIPIPLPFLESTWAGVAMAGGLLYLLITAPRRWLSRCVGALVIAAYGWIGLGLAGILLDTPLQTYRVYPVVEYLLALALLIGLLRLWYGEVALPISLQTPDLRRGLQRLAAAALLGFMLFFGRGVIVAIQSEENVQDALTATYPAAQLARYDALTAGDYLDKEIWLSNHYIDLLIFRPVYSFVAWSAYYSHPAGRFRDRIDFLEKLAKLQSPQLFATALMNNQYSKGIDYILLRPEAGHWRFAFVDDNFPDRVVSRDFYFAEQLLAEPYFAAQRDGDLTLFRPIYTANPYAALVAQSTEGDVAATAQLYVLATTFAGDQSPTLPAVSSATLAANLLTADLAALPAPLLLDLYQASTDQLRERVAATFRKTLGLAAPVTLVDAAGQAVLQVLGYTLQPQPAGDYTLTLYWQPLAPVPADYTVWVHLYQADQQFNFDHSPLLAMSRWPPGTIYADRTPIQVATGDYTLRFGFWQPDVDQRLVQPSGAYEVDGGEVRVR